MARTFSILFIAAVLACSSDDDEIKATNPALAVKRAARFCDVPQGEMTWLYVLIESSQSDPQLEGPIYAFRSNGQGIIMHQPWLRSCLGCILYDCAGNRLDFQDIDATALSAGFQNLTEIYAPVLE